MKTDKILYPFTPGPWKAWQDTGNSLAVSPEENDAICLAQIVDVETDEITDTMRADAALMASAPELYDALKNCSEWIDSYFQDKGHSGNICDEYRAAIAALRKANAE